jgi:hypothetical protein
MCVVSAYASAPAPSTTRADTGTPATSSVPMLSIRLGMPMIVLPSETT